MIEAVILDMDGLLIDSEPYWQASERLIMKEYGIELSPEMHSATLGLRCDEQTQYWYKRYPWPNPDFAKIDRQYEEMMLDFFNNEASLMDGAEYIINFFSEQKMPLALASSSSMVLINAFIERFNLKKYFTLVRSAENEKYGKPHPAVYLSTAKMLNKSPMSCLAFEDSLNGLLAAKAAQMKAVIVPDPRTSRREKFDIADMQLNNLKEFGSKELQILMK
jgi:mannitol-1-/sugar-/sorbitol-6-/2-deoxyglucose-6-phosphatase